MEINDDEKNGLINVGLIMYFGVEIGKHYSERLFFYTDRSVCLTKKNFCLLLFT